MTPRCPNTNPEACRNGVEGFAVGAHGTHPTPHLIGDDVVGVRFPAQEPLWVSSGPMSIPRDVEQPKADCMVAVFFTRDVLKICGPVVGLDTVDVVDLHPGRARTKEREGHFNVDYDSASAPTRAEHGALVAPLRRRGGEDLPWPRPRTSRIASNPAEIGDAVKTFKSTNRQPSLFGHRTPPMNSIHHDSTDTLAITPL